MSGLLGSISENLNASEAAVRLLFSILLGFPIAIIHRYTLYGKNPVRQHLFFIICGIAIGYWNYGFNIFHSATALCATFAIFKIAGSTSEAVILTFLFNMSYLLYGYYTTSTQDYDIKWTMPQCVLTLRLIGLAFNLWDGSKPEEKLSVTQKQVALKTQPSFFEVAAYAYFPGSFLVGPQFSMKRYLDFVNGCLLDHDSKKATNELPACVIPGVSRALLGFMYVALYQFGTIYVSDQYLLDDEYRNQNFFKRLILIGFWGHVNLYKYVSCWLLTEGVCTTFGLTYNGRDDKGNEVWNGCENVDVLTFEKASRFNHYIMSFNINTNNWCAEYIYKRLKFLGSKFYSQFATLLFLAIWHGFHSGYYLCFFLEFLIMYTEKDVIQLLERYDGLQRLLQRNMLLRLILSIVTKVYTFVFMGYSLVCFVFLSYTRYNRVYASVYYCGHVIYFTYPLVSIILRRFLRNTPKKYE